MNYLSFQTAQFNCQGSSYQPASYDDIYAGKTRMPLPDPFPAAADVDVADASVHGLGLFEAAQSTTQGTKAWPNVSFAGQAPTGKCLNTDGPPGLPDFTAAPLDALNALQLDAAKQAGLDTKDESSYARCLGTKGINASSRIDLVAQVQGQAAAYTTSSVQAATAKPVGPSWNAVVAAERTAAIADAECRSSDHQRYLATLRQTLPSFLSEHKNEIASVELQWKQIVEKANARRATL